MKKFIIIALFIMMATPVFAQKSSIDIKRVSVKKYQASKAETQPKLFTVPLVGHLNVITSHSVKYEFSAEIALPSPDNAPSYEAYQRMVENSITQQIEELKGRALFEFSEANNADIIVSPTYSIITESNQGLVLNVNIKIKGFPAVYTSFSEMKNSDGELVNINSMIDTQKLVENQVKTSTSATTKEVMR